MAMKNFYLAIFLLCFGTGASAQLNRMGVLISNQTVSFPVTGASSTFHSQFHPGIDLYFQQAPKADLSHQFVYNIGAGIQYHRFFQTGLRIYAWGDYCYQPNAVWQFNAGIGAGYLHAFPDYMRFRQDADGGWEKIPALNGRPQLLAGTGLGVSRAIRKSEPNALRLELRWKSFIQLPFAGSYIPMLPSNALMLGLSASINNKKGSKS